MVREPLHSDKLIALRRLAANSNVQGSYHIKNTPAKKKVPVPQSSGLVERIAFKLHEARQNSPSTEAASILQPRPRNA